MIRFDLDLVPEGVRRIRRALADQPVYVVGGILRDSILDALDRGMEEITEVRGDDWDLATSARPEEVLAVLERAGIRVVPIGIDHGTVAAIIDRKQYEITTFRKDRICDGRHAVVEFSHSLEDELERRDFTINAFALDLDTGGIYDPLGGIEDLKTRTVRAIGEPTTRFQEDYLRMLRAVRFAAQIEGRIEPKTWRALCQQSENISKISPERIRDEILKLMKTPQPSVGFRMMLESGLLKRILPEFDNCFGVAQNRYHPDCVGEHTVHCVDEVSPRFPFLRWVMLLHDIGKPLMKAFAEEKDDYVFYDHQFEGESMAEEIMRRLRFSNSEIETAQVLIREHMFNLTPDLSKKGVRRLVRRVGAERIRDLLRLRIADRLGNRSNPRTLEPHFKKLIRQIREIERDEECLHIKDLAIGGKELIARGLRPGPVFSKILNALLERVLDDPSLNTPEDLNQLVDEWLRTQNGTKPHCPT